MNSRFAIFLLLLMNCLGACREDNVTPEQDKCKHILAHLSTYKHKTINLAGRMPQNGTIMGYLDGEELKMASASSFSLRGRREENYFFHNNHLIAVQQDDYTYNVPQYITEAVAKTTGDTVWYDDTKTIMRTSWFYFYNSHMVKWIDPQHRIVPDNLQSFDYKDEELQHNAEKLKEMLLQ